MSASNPSPIVTEVLRFEDLPPGSRGTRRAIATGQELFFGCYADPDALPAIQQLPALIEAELHQLGRAPTQAPTSDTRSPPPNPGPRRPSRTSGQGGRAMNPRTE